MQQFTFNIDQKIQMWTRSIKTIQAENYEQAEKILKEEYFNGEIFERLDEYEYLHDTQEDMDIVEILNEYGNIINLKLELNNQ